jgi:hypothetical protein
LILRLGAWIILPLLAGLLPERPQVNGFAASVVIILLTVAAVDFEFGQRGQRKFLSNLGYGRPATLGLALTLTSTVEVLFNLAVSVL